MATITGTSGADTLIGTDDDDILQSLGGIDYMSGGGGADEYQLYQTGGTHHVTIEDLGGDGAIDTITGGRGLFASASLGYSAWATAEHVGDDLIITLPGKPSRFRKPGYGPVTIEVIDQYAGEEVEYLVAGGITYRLTILSEGSSENDIMAGTSSADVFIGRGGDDFMTGNKGRDSLTAGGGNDTVFGGNGKDTISGGGGNDRIYGDAGIDTIKAGSGHDFVYLGLGDDKAWGNSGNDYLYGQTGNNKMYGGKGQDLIVSGDGNDRMFGGADGDTYRIGYDLAALGPADGWGHDFIKDDGEPVAAYNNFDKIELFGFYGPSSGNRAEAFARLSFERAGQNMIMSADDGSSTLKVRKQFDPLTSKYAVEELEFNAAYWEPLHFKILDGQRDDIGDDRRYSNGIGGEYNELLFGTDSDDQVFGDSGTNFIWLGDGADTLIYKESDPQPFSGYGGGAANDIVLDFDVAEDRFDFTEIKGISFEDLTIATAADGDATIAWDSGTVEVSDIYIELRGVVVADITADLFDFV